jgi:hypothetical protein
MGKDRLSYGEFKQQFLVQLALSSKGDTDKHNNPSEVAMLVEGLFQESWIRAVEKELKDTGMADGRSFVGGSTISITGPGLEQAEDWAGDYGIDLWEEINDQDHEDTTNPTEEIRIKSGEETASAVRIVEIDRLSDAYKSLDRELKRTIDNLKADNELISKTGKESSQRVSELEAGKTLLQAEQADVGLIERLLLPSLKWFLTKVRDEATGQMIKVLIALIVAFLASK